MKLNTEQRALLKTIARESIRHGLTQGSPLKIDLDKVDEVLREPAATFVTLNRNGQLRGCIGSLQAILPLAQDVAQNAYSAAFRDYRFPPLTADEFEDLDIHISLLSEPTPMTVRSEEDLLSQLRPGKDGLILHDGEYRSTFLPQVWESLPRPEQFVAELKRKAGLNPDYWSDTIDFERYTVETV
jgi:AmmeMemoRadiSam system protein A